MNDRPHDAYLLQEIDGRHQPLADTPPAPPAEQPRSAFHHAELTRIEIAELRGTLERLHAQLLGLTSEPGWPPPPAPAGVRPRAGREARRQARSG